MAFGRTAMASVLPSRDASRPGAKRSFRHPVAGGVGRRLGQGGRRRPSGSTANPSALPEMRSRVVTVVTRSTRGRASSFVAIGVQAFQDVAAIQAGALQHDRQHLVAGEVAAQFVAQLHGPASRPGSTGLGGVVQLQPGG